MKLLVLTKRQYMGKDLLGDRFGRFRELPLQLSHRGHEVKGLCLSYRSREEGASLDIDTREKGGVLWESVNLAHGFAPPLGRYFLHLRKLLRGFQPDLIWAGSDAYHAIFGFWLAGRLTTRCVIDLYDNFEAFAASKLPLVLPLFRRAVREAHGVTCFSQRLETFIVDTYARRKPTSVIETGVRTDLFYPKRQDVCRQRLGLPRDAQIIGTAGALGASRGIQTLFDAFELLATENPHLHLALAGPRESGVRIPTGPRIHDLGTLPHEKVPSFVNALDLAVICYRASAQGEFSFPQKAYEIVACQIPLIAAAVGSMNEFMSAYPDCLYEPENAKSLAAAARRQLQKRIAVEKEVPSWGDSAGRLELFFKRILGSELDKIGNAQAGR
jgi:glycosyltransferase involved in cell wall biosynthesis